MFCANVASYPVVKETKATIKVYSGLEARIVFSAVATLLSVACIASYLTGANAITVSLLAVGGIGFILSGSLFVYFIVREVQFRYRVQNLLESGSKSNDNWWRDNFEMLKSKNKGSVPQSFYLNVWVVFIKEGDQKTIEIYRKGRDATERSLSFEESS